MLADKECSLKDLQNIISFKKRYEATLNQEKSILPIKCEVVFPPKGESLLVYAFKYCQSKEKIEEIIKEFTNTGLYMIEYL